MRRFPAKSFLLCFRFPLLSCFRPALLLGFLPCLLSCSLSCFLGFVDWLLCLVGLLFPFPLRTIRKKERAQGFAPCVLSSCVACCLNSCIVIKEFRCRCFGFFQFARLVLPCNTASIRRLARSNFDFIRHNVDITNNRSAFLK